MRITHSERMAAVETEEQREARLQKMRANQSDRLAAETEEQREARKQRMRANQTVVDWLPRLKNRERPGCRGCVPINMRDWLLRLNSGERPGCNETERDNNSHCHLCKQRCVNFSFTVQYIGCAYMYHLF